MSCGRFDLHFDHVVENSHFASDHYIMAKGSQLTQLKSALSFDSQKNASKKRKRGSVSTEKEKEKRNARLEAINKKMNPFDTKVTKTKFDVGGKQKGIKGNPAKSKLAGIQQVRNYMLLGTEAT